MADDARPQRIAGMALLAELLTVIGPIGVLGLWLYQQTELERNAGELRKIAAARAVYQTYQSNNGLFNGLHEVLRHDREGAERTRNFQIYSYELGLAALEDALPEADRKGIPPRVDAYSGDSFEARQPRLQSRLEALQGKLAEREQNVRNIANVQQQWYFWIFVVLSLLSILGAVIRTAPKLRPAAS
jgi:hypothetical protein